VSQADPVRPPHPPLSRRRQTNKQQQIASKHHNNNPHKQQNMKLTQQPNIKRNAGMTLIELTVVIVVLLALIAVLFVGARAYLKGADKAACVLNQRNIQQAGRSWYNLNPQSAADVTIGDLVGEGKFIENAPTCPPKTAANVYAIAETFVRGCAPGVLATSCPDTEEGVADYHTPADTANW
jgi:type II secretory pathway pseudopilin PulG